MLIVDWKNYIPPKQISWVRLRMRPLSFMKTVNFDEGQYIHRGTRYLHSWQTGQHDSAVSASSEKSSSSEARRRSSDLRWSWCSRWYFQSLQACVRLPPLDLLLFWVSQIIRHNDRPQRTSATQVLPIAFLARANSLSLSLPTRRVGSSYPSVWDCTIT